MHALQALGALAACAGAAHAFAGTYPVVAWSDSRLHLASLLNPTPSSRTAAAAADGQQAFSLERTDAEPADLCSLSSLTFLVAPGLAYSDLALLPTSSDSAIRTALAADSSITVPYVSTSLAGVHAPASRIARRFNKCTRSGERKITVAVIDGLDTTEAGSAQDREARRDIMLQLDAAAHDLETASTGRHAIIVTAVRPSIAKSKGKSQQRAAKSLVKRQGDFASDSAASEESYIEELLEEIAAEDAVEASEAALGEDADADVLARPVVEDGEAVEVTPDEYAAAVDPYTEWDGSILDVTPLKKGSSGDDDEDDGGDEGSRNGTSIFQPKPNSGLFHRYVFFTPALILSVLITVIVLVPTVLVGASALLAIETPHGLETKMTGSTGLDPSKAQ
ncbi:hypothetical protein JCM9279_007301 [Rhodotorula babjevae]